MENSIDVQVRLAVIWRSKTIISREFPLTLPTIPIISKSPKLMKQLQLSRDQYLICWSSTSTHDQQKFLVELKNLDDKIIYSHETTSTCHIFRELPKENCCRATIADLTGASEKVVKPFEKTTLEPPTTTMTTTGENAVTSSMSTMETTTVETIEKIETSSIKNLNFEGLPELHIDIEIKDVTEPNFMEKELVFTNGTNLFKMADMNDYVLMTDPMVIPFKLEKDQRITALAASSLTKLYIGLSDGSIFSIDLNDFETTNSTEPEKVQIREKDDIPIVQIEIDQMQQKLYAVREKEGLIRCGLQDCLNSTMLMTNSANFIKNIAVDYWNGFLYYATNNGDVFSAPLFPIDAPSTYSFSITRRLAQIPEVYTLQIDFSLQKFIALLKNGTLLSMNLVDQSLKDEREEVPLNTKFENVIKSEFVDNRLFWISTSCGESHPWEKCLFSEEKDVKEEKIHLNKYIYGGNIQDFTISRNFLLPSYILPITKIGLMMSDTQARITWKPPESLHFQAPGSSWRVLTYEVNLISEGTKESFSLAETELLVNITPGITYTASIKACTISGVCTDFVNATNSAFGPHKSAVPVVIYTKNGDALKMMDLLGRELVDVDGYYPTLYSKNEKVIGWENTTKTLYTASPSAVSIWREFSNGDDYKFLDSISINHMSIMPKRSLLIIASSYLIVSYRLTSSFEQIIYSCSSTDCGEVIALASDDKSGEIFYLIQETNGTFQLYSMNLAQRTPILVSTTQKLPPLRQMVIMEEKFLFITEDGMVGSFDKQLGNLNINYALRDVVYLVTVDENSAENRFDFTNEIEIGVTGRSEISWQVDRRFSLGQVLYKIEMFKENFAGERTSEVSMASKLSIPQNVLDKWASRQIFDVKIDAITAWTIVSTNRTGLKAPTKPPSAPQGLKIYTTQQKKVDGARAIIDLFWEEPKEWNGDMLGYVVNCSNFDSDAESGPSKIIANVSARHYRTHSFVVKSGKVSCAVAATNEQNFIGKFSEPVSIDSSEVRPYLRLFTIDSIGNLISLTNWSSVQEAVRTKRQIQGNNQAKRQTNQVQYQTVSFIENNLYGIKKEVDNTQPFIVLLDMNDVNIEIHKVSINGDFSEIEAMASDWVANRLLIIANHQIMQISLETFQSSTVVTPKKLFSLSSGAQEAKQLLFDPFINTAYLLTKNGSLFSLDLAKGTEQNLGLSLDCLKSQTVTSMMSAFAWNRPASPLIYALTWNGLITIDPTASNSSKICLEINPPIEWSKFGEKGLKAITLFSIADKFYVFVTSSELLIYDKMSTSITPIPIVNPPLKQILAVSQSSQPYPDRSCFVLPSSSNINFTVKNEGRSGALVEIQEPKIPNNCQNISFPPTQYEIYFKKKDSDKIKTIKSLSNVVHLENGNLDKETDYEVSVSWFNRYYPATGSTSETKNFKTSYGYPTAPQNPAAFALTPNTVLIYWKLPQTLNAPKKEIKYRITQQSSALASPVSIGAKEFDNGNFANGPSDIVSCDEDPCQAKIANLRPAEDYKFWVTAVHTTREKNQFPDDSEAVSAEALTRTKDIPGTLRHENVTGDTMMLRWTWLEPGSPPSKVYIQYRQSGVDASWISPPNTTFNPVEKKSGVNLTIDNLRSATNYDYRFVGSYDGILEYEGSKKNFSENFYQATQQGRTKAGTPSEPRDVKLDQDQEGFILRWQAPETDGGASISSYAVEYRPNSTAEWEIAERGLAPDKTTWRPVKIADPQKSEFRIRAANSEGFGSYAFTKHDHVTIDEKRPISFIWLWILLAILIGLLTGCLALGMRIRRKKLEQKRRKEKLNKAFHLDKLDQMNFPESPLEIPPEIQNEIKNLPAVERVVFQSRLGKGSFGEVFEGIAILKDGSGKSAKVAIKTLRPGNSQVDRIKFIKEAILMNNFDHPNIVKLLGVSFADEPHHLVIELMEGGDLLGFLRTSRPTEVMPSQLSLKELICMMVDVGRGGSYLEANKHVHRDLAARNCLISSRSSSMRITKIADFGLAREIYANDYYRVNGEDFLPLRWLAPESAHDGIFTSKSDVWSFGILLWEILTLGEQPYPRMENLQVLAYVKNEGHPDKPFDCPDEIFEIVQKAWVANPEQRPTFADLLPYLEALRGRPEYQSNSPFPSSSLFGTSNSVFDHSMDSTSGSNGGSIGRDRPEFGRFDKSENPSNKKHGRPSILRSLRKDSKDRSTEDPPNRSVFRPESVLSNETNTTMCDLDYEIPRNRSTPETSSSSGIILGPYGNNGFWNEGFDSMESSTSQSRPSLASAPGGVVNPSFIGSDYYDRSTFRLSDSGDSSRPLSKSAYPSVPYRSNKPRAPPPPIPIPRSTTTHNYSGSDESSPDSEKPRPRARVSRV
uniref:receptor protein-tyrosine kinase n=1 Tax=Acrobeloides nanus TaxID=290746 RepID=A0A914C3G4_9BILA